MVMKYHDYVTICIPLDSHGDITDFLDVQYVASGPRGPWSVTFPTMMLILKEANIANDLLISLQSYDEVSSFLPLAKARNSSLFTGE